MAGVMLDMEIIHKKLAHKMHLICQELGLQETNWNHLTVDQSTNWHIIFCTNFLCTLCMHTS